MAQSRKLSSARFYEEFPEYKRTHPGYIKRDPFEKLRKAQPTPEMSRFLDLIAVDDAEANQSIKSLWIQYAMWCRRESVPRENRVRFGVALQQRFRDRYKRTMRFYFGCRAIYRFPESDKPEEKAAEYAARESFFANAPLPGEPAKKLGQKEKAATGFKYFARSYLVIKDGASASTMEVYNAYSRWCARSNRKALTVKSFVTHLKTLSGIEPIHGAAGVRVRRWKNLELHEPTGPARDMTAVDEKLLDTFFGRECIFEPDYSVMVDPLYRYYRRWSTLEGLAAFTLADFDTYLLANGIVRKGSVRTGRYVGLAVRDGDTKLV